MVEFRRAVPGDCKKIAEMENKYIECPWSESVIAATLDDELSAVYVLLSDGEIIAYGGIKIALDTAEVYNIVVDENYRRTGYGAKVLEKLMEHAVERGAREIFLEVNENNEPAINLYASRGFKISHMRKNYYKSGNALVMRKEV